MTTRKIEGMVEQRRLSILYGYDGNIIDCRFAIAAGRDGILVDDYEGFGQAICSPKEPKNKEKFGRMIALARAVFNYFRVELPNGAELEKLVKGENFVRRNDE